MLICSKDCINFKEADFICVQGATPDQNKLDNIIQKMMVSSIKYL